MFCVRIVKYREISKEIHFRFGPLGVAPSIMLACTAE